MKRSETLQKLAAHRDELTPMDVKTLAVFGSVARDEARQDRDVDIMVKFQGPATFNGYMDLKFFLEDMQGNSVDLVTRKSIRPRFKTQIEKEAATFIPTHIRKPLPRGSLPPLLLPLV